MALLGMLYVLQTRLQNRRTKTSGQAQRERIEIPSRSTLLAKSRNIHKESEEAFERAVDVALGIRRVPQLVRAQHLPHIKSRSTTTARPLTEPLVDYLLRVEKLLIVGAPGAGKTETLRTAWGELLDRAQTDPSLPVPFLVNLSTFSRYPGSFRDWLAESLRECAGIPLSIGQILLERGRLFLFLLLDGLDEMAESRRAVALTELNELLANADPAIGRCIVCSRTLEYEKAEVTLSLPAALELQPLTAEQVQSAIVKAGPAAQPLAAAIGRDPVLAELLGTPLLLSIAARTFAGNPGLVIAGQGSAELRQALLDAYIAQMLRRRPVGSATPSLRLLRCLHWLAQYMTSAQSSLFLMERLQPTALRTDQLYKLAVGLVFGLVFGLILGLIFGLVFGLVFGLSANEVQPVEQMRWSWPRIREHREWKTFLRDCLVFQLVFGLVGGLLGGLIGPQVGGRTGGLYYGLLFGPVLGLVHHLSQGWTKTLNEQSIRPNQGIHSSIRNGVTEGITIGLVFGLVFGLVSVLITGLAFGLPFVPVLVLRSVLYLGWFFGLPVGLFFLLRGGLGEALKHYVLRAFLWYEVGLPLRLVPWLELCRSLLLLRREGGGYRFWHATLQEHFASLDDARLNEIAHRSLAEEFYQPRY